MSERYRRSVALPKRIAPDTRAATRSKASKPHRAVSLMSADETTMIPKTLTVNTHSENFIAFWSDCI